VKRKEMKYLCFIVAAALLTGCKANDYDPFGAIQGEVRGQSRYNVAGISLRGAQVALLKGGVTFKSQTTASSGEFSFTNLDAGEYTLSASRADYTTVEKTVNVYAGETTPVAIMLQESKEE
jgi:hypothetical protein